MTKRELATQLAKKMKAINPMVNEATAIKVLSKGMTKEELIKALQED